MKNVVYSGTPLEKKLGIKTGFKIKTVNQPDYYFTLFANLPPEITEAPDRKVKKDFIHYFAISSSQLNKDLQLLKEEIEENGMIWISWPKKSAKIETDLNGNVVREIGLKIGLVDIKVCAVDKIWSGLKFVKRMKERK